MQVSLNNRQFLAAEAGRGRHRRGLHHRELARGCRHHSAGQVGERLRGRGVRVVDDQRHARVRLGTELLLQRNRGQQGHVGLVRQELAAGMTEAETPPVPEARGPRRATVALRGPGSLYRLDDVLEDTGADQSLVKELEDYGVIKGERRDGEQLYDDTEREIIRAVTELKRFGVGGRNLRVFRTSADREAALLEQILAPALRSRNPERRKEAVEALENLAAVASHLKHLLLIRDLRKLAR